MPSREKPKSGTTDTASEPSKTESFTPTPRTTVHNIETPVDFSLDELDPPKINRPPHFRSEFEYAQPWEITYRHRHWSWRRRRVWDALQRVNTDGQRLIRFKECGAKLTLNINDGPYLSSQTCRDRWCDPCSRTQARYIAEQIKKLLLPSATRFCTLTLRHSATPLTDQLNFLYDSYRKLRQRTIWNQQTASLAICEIKYIPTTTRWHPHLHVLTVGNFIDAYDLSDQWHRVTHDSYVTHIKRVTTIDQAYHHLSSYMTKPFGADVYEYPNALDEAIISMRSRRSLISSGKWNKVRFRRKSEADTYKDDAGRICTTSPSHKVATIQSIIDRTNPNSTRYSEIIQRDMPRLWNVIKPKE